MSPWFWKRNDRKDRLEDRVDSLVYSLKNAGGSAPAIFLDTGAIIDFEDDLRRTHTWDKGVNPMLFYGLLLKKMGPETDFFVTWDVLRELESHFKNNTVHGMREISGVSCYAAEAMAHNYLTFLCPPGFVSQPDPSDLRHLDNLPWAFEKIRHEVYWASRFAFERDETNGLLSKHFVKKGSADPMSPADRDLVAHALLCQSLPRVPFPPFYIVPSTNSYTNVVIVSPDKHVSETVRVLVGQHPNPEYRTLFPYKNIEVVKSREN